jgi:predicted nucleotidyltransferase
MSVDESGAVAKAGASDDAPSEEEMRERLIELAFGGDPRRLEEFCDVVRRAVPPDTAVVLRGSAVTGRRWKDGTPFDGDGPGTSDLDLTLVGSEVLGNYILDGFYIPGVHTKPLSDKDPDIAPDLVPLRERLVAMVGRPVNIQATRDFVMQLRGEWMGQPYLTLIGKVGGE